MGQSSPYISAFRCYRDIPLTACCRGLNRPSLMRLDSRGGFGQSSDMRNMMLVAPLLLLLLVPGSVAATAIATETTNRTYCDDEETRRDWEQHTANSPDDRELQMLHALWLGLCVKVQRHGFATDEAIHIFEDLRRTVIEQRREHNAVKEQKPKR